MTRHALALGIALLLASPVVRADGAECLRGSEDGLKARDEGRLREARRLFVACAADACPKQLRIDCARWLEDIDATMPSASFGAQDAQGVDLFDVTVIVDGEKMTGHERGKSVAIDPGPHLVRFERPDGTSVEQRVLMRAGERNRPILARFVDRTEVPPRLQKTTVPTISIVLGAVGIGALGSFAFFGISGLQEKDKLRARCEPRCTDDDLSGLKGRYIAADVSLGVGIVALGLATYFFLANDKPSQVSFARTIWK